MCVLLEKYLVTLVQDGMADFIQDHHSRYCNLCNGIVQGGREMGLPSEYSMASGNL